MVAPADGTKQIAFRKGFLGPQAVIQIIAAVEKLCGIVARDAIMRTAKIARLPEWNEPVREDKVARLHQALRRNHPEQAVAIARLAGQATTDYLLDNRISKRAQKLLSAAPKPVALWLLSQSSKQNARAFGGSGAFEVTGPGVFELRRNPLLQGEAAHGPICHYHAAAFERMYQRLIDPRMVCREVTCIASGGASCRFELGMAA